MQRQRGRRGGPRRGARGAHPTPAFLSPAADRSARAGAKGAGALPCGTESRTGRTERSCYGICGSKGLEASRIESRIKRSFHTCSSGRKSALNFPKKNEPTHVGCYGKWSVVTASEVKNPAPVTAPFGHGDPGGASSGPFGLNPTESDLIRLHPNGAVGVVQLVQAAGSQRLSPVPASPKPTTAFVLSLSINHQLPSHQPFCSPFRLNPTKSNLIRPDSDAVAGVVSSFQTALWPLAPGSPKPTTACVLPLTINHQLPNHPPFSGPLGLNQTKSNLIKPNPTFVTVEQ